MSTIRVRKVKASSEYGFKIQIPSSAILNINGSYAISEDHAFKVPVGTTAQRPSSPQTGSIRYNTDEGTVEGYTGTYWINLMISGNTSSAGIPKQGLVIHLDSNDPNSLLQQGEQDDNYWYNLVSQNWNFGIPSDRMANFTNNSGQNVRFMDFSVNGSGCAKVANTGGYTDVPWYPHCSVIFFLKWRTDNSQWRTPLRSRDADHHIIVQDGTRNLGMYDNNAAGFQDSGYDIDQFPEWNTKFNMYTWRFCSNTGYGSYTPVYQCFFKDEANARATINNGNAQYDRGFYHVGAWGEGNINPHSTSQNCGSIGVFMYYNRHITQAERLQIYNYYKSTYDI